MTNIAEGATLTGWQMHLGIGPGRPILAFDPGLRTGIAVSDTEGNVYGAEADWDDSLLYAQKMLRLFEGHDLLVICESFTINEKTVRNSSAPWSLEGIGALRFLARRFKAELRMQQPVEAKSFATNPRLKAQGWYVSTPGGHVNDALRHLYLAAVKMRRLEPPAGVV